MSEHTNTRTLSAESLHSALHDALREHFGYESFRPGQAEVISAAVAGHSVLGVMPTGSGKSLCYQIASLLRPGGTLVISPLIALMKDQVDSIAGVTGLRVGVLNSTVSRYEQDAAIRAWEDGELDLLYAAPERFRNRRFLDAMVRRHPEILAIDEAHCVSQWGHDFRPDYLFLRTVIERLKIPVTLALTATATPDVQEDILAQLGLPDARVIVTGFDRPNLHLEVHRLGSDRQKRDRLKELMQDVSGSGIVYCGTRKDAQATAEFLNGLGYRAAMYHGDMDAEARTDIQNRFMEGDIQVVCATNAFGLGVNKQDIRFVFHIALPGTMEALYQEMGRAGRDGKPARCALLFSPGDLPLQRFFIQSATPLRKDLVNLYGFLRMRGPQPEFDWGEAAALMDASDIRVRATLSELEKASLAQRISDSEIGSVRVRLLDGVNPETAIARRERDLDAIRAQRLRKLQAVEAYARLTTCRRAFIRRYFGEEDVPETCTNCDICAPQSGIVIAPVEEPDVERSEDAALTILRCVARYNGRLGRTTIAQVLAGSKSKKIAETEWYAEWLGKLEEIPQVRISEAIEELLTMGYLDTGVLSRNETVFPVLELSPQGRAVVQGREPAPTVAISKAAPVKEKPEKEAPASAPETPEDQDLFDRLRAWRLRTARANGWAPYVILTDADLREIVAHRPSTPDELLALRGFGPTKVEKWGEPVLSIVAEMETVPSE